VLTLFAECQGQHSAKKNFFKKKKKFFCRVSATSALGKEAVKLTVAVFFAEC
jgi:hypothetical protein